MSDDHKHGWKVFGICTGGLVLLIVGYLVFKAIGWTNHDEDTPDPNSFVGGLFVGMAYIGSILALHRGLGGWPIADKPQRDKKAREFEALCRAVADGTASPGGGIMEELFEREREREAEKKAKKREAREARKRAESQQATEPTKPAKPPETGNPQRPDGYKAPKKYGGTWPDPE